MAFKTGGLHPSGKSPPSQSGSMTIASALSTRLDGISVVGCLIFLSSESDPCTFHPTVSTSNHSWATFAALHKTHVIAICCTCVAWESGRASLQAHARARAQVEVRSRRLCAGRLGRGGVGAAVARTRKACTRISGLVSVGADGSARQTDRAWQACQVRI